MIFDDEEDDVDDDDNDDDTFRKYGTPQNQSGTCSIFSIIDFKVHLPSTKPSGPRINITPFRKGGVPLKHNPPAH